MQFLGRTDSRKTFGFIREQKTPAVCQVTDFHELVSLHVTTGHYLQLKYRVHREIAHTSPNCLLLRLSGTTAGLHSYLLGCCTSTMLFSVPSSPLVPTRLGTPGLGLSGSRRSPGTPGVQQQEQAGSTRCLPPAALITHLCLWFFPPTTAREMASVVQCCPCCGTSSTPRTS